jgi:putative glutamine amidotransferase
VTSDHPRPLIGVSTYRQVTSWWAWERDAALVPGPYLDMVAAAGGLPLLLPPPAEPVAVPDPPGGRALDPADLDRVVGRLDGLLLIGGGDMDAARYGQPGDPRNGGTSGRRDELELGLLTAALARDLPVLAVCRGIQVLNVALGGDLIQHLPDVVGSTRHQPRAGAFGPIEVTAEPDSRVGRMLGERFEVLCCHHQALATLGRGLEVTATSADGVVEAVELPGYRFVVGVQWHPEESGDTRLFETLIGEARRGTAAALSTTPYEEQT